jgi:hypothetical protein
VHQVCDDVWSLNTPRLAADPFFAIGNVGDPKLLFQNSVVAQPLAALTEEMVSFQPVGMLAAWKFPHLAVCVQVRSLPPKLLFS